MTDAEFVARFESGTLPAASFHHCEHVRLAWVYLQQQPLLAALDRFSSGLRRFAAQAGKPDRYHETITWAYLLLMSERCRRGGAETWAAFAADNPDLLCWQPSVLERYYHATTLKSAQARTSFVFPDRFVAAL